MLIEQRRGAKLRRVINYAGVALIVAWSLVALATYAGIEAAVTWLAGLGAAYGLIAWFAELAAPVDGPIVAILWVTGVAAVCALTFLLRRVTASV